MTKEEIYNDIEKQHSSAISELCVSYAKDTLKCRTCKYLLANYQDEPVDEKVWDICLKVSGNNRPIVPPAEQENAWASAELFVKPSFGCILWDCKDNPEFTK